VFLQVELRQTGVTLDGGAGVQGKAPELHVT
jgi:hypothetical protein